MSIFRTYRNIRAKQWLLLIAFWTFVGVFISAQLYFNTIKNGGQPVAIKIFLDQLPIWYSWALVTPLILFVVNRVPLTPSSVLKPLVVYLGFGLVLLFVMTNLTLVYMFIIHGYIDLTNTNMAEYSPYFFSRIANDGLIFVFVLAVIISFRSYGVRRKNELEMALLQLKNDQLQNQLTQAQLQALKLQLNPHFLFNTLHTISSLTLIGERDSSANMTMRLGDFLRRTLDFEEAQLVSLSRELEFFDLYLEIESERFKDRLTIRKDIDPSCLSIKVPNLILQPLVENAVKHGVARSKEAKLIELKIKKLDDAMEIWLYNDGPALKHNSENGIGLSNIRSRLEKLYDNYFRFDLKNDESGKGVNSILRIPFQTTAVNGEI